MSGAQPKRSECFGCSECFGHSGNYATTNLPGADLDRAATPQGCAAGKAHIKKIGKMGRFPFAAVDYP